MNPILERLRTKPFFALRESLKKGYGLSDLKADFLSAAVVALVAIPLGMALAIACGLPPENGLYTVIVAGIIVAVMGGSRFQVTGPTAAFVVILAPITHRFGMKGLLIASMIAGIILIFMGLTGIGKLIQYIPYPVTSGFTAGIAVVIATLQIKDFLGLAIVDMPERFIEKSLTIITHLPTLQWNEFLTGTLTLTILIFWPKFHKRIPAPLVALTTVTVLTSLLRNLFPENLFFHINTISSRFQFSLNGVTGNGIPPTGPSFTLPWNTAGPLQSAFVLDTNTFQALLFAGVSIAVLGAIESLLSAVIADGMAQTKHDPDSELLALGVANFVGPFFGAFASTGALARTATNIRFGAKSPISAIIHGVITLFVVLFFAKWVSFIPLASLAALLLVVAYNMADIKHFTYILRVAPKEDVAVLYLCFGLTVLFDMTVGVATGVLAASLMFIKNASETSGAKAVTDTLESAPLKDEKIEPISKNIQIYRIDGPLFFGAAEKATRALDSIDDNIKFVIFLMDTVPFLDVTGLMALETAVSRLDKKGITVCLVGEQTLLAEMISKSVVIGSKRAQNKREKILLESSSDVDSKVKHFSILSHALSWITSLDRFTGSLK